VRHLASNSQDASIVGALVSLGKSLHMRVVAEGVETPEQFALLRDQNCPEGQGFYFCPAMPAAEFDGHPGNAAVQGPG
jgi:diguanylate cyclase